MQPRRRHRDLRQLRNSRRRILSATLWGEEEAPLRSNGVGEGVSSTGEMSLQGLAVRALPTPRDARASALSAPFGDGEGSSYFMRGEWNL
jgi:hypothetical protein